MDTLTLPKLPVSDPAQILIHPEHADGSLKVPSPKVKKSSHQTLNIISTILIIMLLTLLAGAYFLIPRTRTVVYARNTAETIGDVSEKTDKVDQSLETLYKMIYEANSQATTEIDSQVLGDRVGPADDLWTSSETVVLAAKNYLSEQGRVKAFTVPEEDPNKATRDLRKLAKEIGTKQDEAASVTPLIANLANEKVSTPSKDLQKEILLVQSKTDKYLSEAEKTSAFYVKISDATIELYNISSTVASEADIKNAISDLTAIRTEFANLNEKTLPEEMDELNKDVVAVFDLMISFYKDADSGKLNSASALLNAYAEFLSQMKSIAVQTSTHELSFWQNNESLANYEDLAAEHTELIKKAASVKDKNNYFLLSYLGVK